RTLDASDLVIADDTGVISLAAVMGGLSTEVSGTTTDILFEAAHWDPVTVARTARRHKLPSEASRRFERGVDPQLTPVALARAAELLSRYAGGEVDGRLTDVYAVTPPAPIAMPADLPARRAGVAYPAERVLELLTGIGAGVEPAADGADRLLVTPPSWRPDLTDPADLTEEVIRLDGYDRVPTELPLAPPGNGLTPNQRRRRSVGRALAEAGYTEVLSYPFVGQAAFDAWGLAADDPRRRTLRVRNPISADEPELRTTLLAPLLAALRRNLGRGHRDLALYEIGLVFHPSGAVGTPPRLGVDRRPTDAELAAAQAYVPAQPWHVAMVAVGETDPGGWWGGGRPADWSDAVEAARLVVDTAGHTATVRATAHLPWHPGRCAEIAVGDEGVVGYAGELHPAVCAALELPRGTVATELDLDALPPPAVTLAPVISPFPPALIDVALVVDRSVPAASVAAALIAGAGELLAAVRLFDVYTGDQLGADRKSLAYKLTFRAPDRTLTVDEAVAARDAAVALAAERVGASLRGA
ncbi:MAG: phenylalanyl-tRNA synthetase beta chain, partial [Micromonosporaceae bacterium]|nr:phenylalanyl-tRNA synthetase beta chain [Micromonosporaceae bacterium]